MSGALIETQTEDPANDLLDLVHQGLSLMERERACLLGGDLTGIVPLTVEKEALLIRLEPALAQAGRNAVVVEALRRLIEESRRNEVLIQAARHGLANAKRRIDAIVETCKGAIAYAEDGSRIKSTADQDGDTRQA